MQRFHHYYGDDFKIECPVGAKETVAIWDASLMVAERLTSLFKKDAKGHRAFHGADWRMAKDPHFNDLVNHFEFFDGDDGRGCGASHQTGWTGLIAKMIERMHADDPPSKNDDTIHQNG